MKKQVVLIIVAVLIIGIGVYLWQSKSSAPSSESQVAGYEAKTNAVQENEMPEEAGVEAGAMKEDKLPEEGVAVESKNLVKATLAEVGTHNKTTDCWAVVDKNVYDLTGWISRHPGGEKAIIGLCGIDGTQAFSRQHGSSEKAKAALVSLLIGNLVE